MYNSIGIVISDELVASELIKYIVREYGGINIKILADLGNLHRINNIFQSNCAFVSVKEILETDCIIVLTDISVFADKLNFYNGKIIDFTGYLKSLVDSGNIYTVLDPVKYIINLLFLDINNISGNIYLPLAVFGKAGIDELLSQTKNVYNFINNKKGYLGVNLPFNVIFLDNCKGSVIKNYVAYMRKQIPHNFSLRLIPAMTGFIADFFYNFNNEPDLSNIELIDNGTDLVDLISSEKIIGIHNSNGAALTIIADYIYIIIKQIIDILKHEVTIE